MGLHRLPVTKGPDGDRSVAVTSRSRFGNRDRGRGISFGRRASRAARIMKQFHSFRLDTVNHCLWRNDERVAMTPKAFDLLRYLVEHSERLVSQREILEALWPA